MPSDKDRLRQVFDHIDRIKARQYPAIVGSDKGHQLVERPWKDMPERAKLAILQDSVDWTGITNRDQAHILLGQVDPGKIADAQRNRLIDAATRGTSGIEDDDRPMTPGEWKAWRDDVMAEDRAVRVMKYGESETAKMEEEARQRAAQEQPSPPRTVPTVTEAELSEMERSFLQPNGQQDRPIRPLTQELIECCQLDVWPGMATVVDFGIDSSSHLGALQFAIREQLVTPQELDTAMGNGQKLTEIAQRGENPYRFVTFRTSWDEMRLEPDEPARDPQDSFADILRNSPSTPLDTRSDFQRLLDEAGERVKTTQAKDRDRGGHER